MERIRHFFDDLGVIMDAKAFLPKWGTGEWYVMLHLENRGDTFTEQLRRIYDAEERLLSLSFFEGACYIKKRYFLSDISNQRKLLRQEKHIAITAIQQPPLDGAKVAAILYLVSRMTVTTEHGMIVASRHGYRHLWLPEQTSTVGDAALQTQTLLEQYNKVLHAFGATLADNCLRTWFFVRDVDTHYEGMVKARREFFLKEGLTSETHYIASTGIEGDPSDTKALVQLAAYAITGLEPGQQRYLYARTHLNATHEYGVTFERGTRVEYGDRLHVIISGTASIDNKGRVMYEGDVKNQTQRMWENVEALLREAGVDFSHAAHFIVYLRDMADYDVVRGMFASRFPDVPTVITLAPVCRPAWLIEMECVAIKEHSNDSYRNY